MVGKNDNDKKKAKTIFVTVVPAISAAAAIMLAFSSPEAFAGGGGGRSGITYECNEAVCQINMTRLTFAPETLKIRPNALVIWTNTDKIPHTVDKIPHTVTSGSPVDKEKKGVLFDSGLSSPIAEGRKWEHKFGDVGTFSYHCQFHPRMVAQVVVSGDPVTEFPPVAYLTLLTGAALASVIALVRLKKKKRDTT